MASSHDPAAALHHALVTRLKLRQLALLQRIDRHRTLGRVAAEMRLSQPAVTKALKEVEDIFGSVLFDRTPRGLVPTPAGDAVLGYAKRWLAELEATAQVVSSFEAGRAGRVRVGLTQQVPQKFISALMDHLLRRAPRVATLVREGTTDELVGLLLAGELDCAIGRSYDGDATGLVQEAVYEQEPCLVVCAKSAKRLARGPLDWARLAKLDWILPPPNTPMRRTYNAVFVGAGVQPPVPMLESTSIRTLETALRDEPNAISILARDVVDEMEAKGHWRALPYRLGWNLPPVSFLTTSALQGNHLVKELRDVVVRATIDMKQRRDASEEGTV
ncbi:MAG: LysR family transcriptional regulator [Comamonadaceae bacterium]|nr:MAG: LysR family transcriptional regulator [Comamonadaceae bacterium]